MDKIANDKPVNIHKNHRSRMKSLYLMHGFDCFSDVEKLEFILYYSIAQKDTNPLAHRLLDEFGSFDLVLEAPVDRLKRIEGLGEHSAIMLSTYLQVISSYGKHKCPDIISGTNSAKQYAINLFKGKVMEEFYVVTLNNSNRVVSCKPINHGSPSFVNVNIRDITNIVLSANCDRLLLMHNHPHGPCRASDEDINFTKKVYMSCVLNSIEVVDHIIASPDGAFSFEENDMLKDLKKTTTETIPLIYRKQVQQEPKHYKKDK